MFSLHWICALTLALVGCLGAQPVRKSPELLSYISDLKKTTEELKCPEDIRLYSPVEITEECMSSALNCTIRELLVLDDECEIQKYDSDVTENVLTLLKAKQTTPTNSNTDCACEKYAQTGVKEFLNNMAHQVQQLN